MNKRYELISLNISRITGAFILSILDNKKGDYINMQIYDEYEGQDEIDACVESILCGLQEEFEDIEIDAKFYNNFKRG